MGGNVGLNLDQRALRRGLFIFVSLCDFPPYDNGCTSFASCPGQSIFVLNT